MEEINRQSSDIVYLRDIPSIGSTRALACSLVGGLVFWAAALSVLL